VVGSLQAPVRVRYVCAVSGRRRGGSKGMNE
jgi:hypothetical protein